MIALFYDTETTGLPLWEQPSSDENQPHIVQLAAALVDLETRVTIASMNVIVRPSGYTIPEEVAAIHGITSARALKFGVSESIAVEMLMELWDRCEVRIGHNEKFDARIIRIALIRHLATIGRDPDQWKDGDAKCTLIMSKPILKLPATAAMRAAGRYHYKSPNLREAFQHFAGVELQGAHDAMNDVLACQRVYFSIQGMADSTN